MLISKDCWNCGEYISKLNLKRVFANFTSLKSRTALQVERKIASCNMALIHYTSFFIFILFSGNALMCKKCSYSSIQPKAEQVCGNATVNCTSGYCFAVNYTSSNGILVVDHDCDDPSDRACPDADDTCEKRTRLYSLKSCAAMCCKTDNCNNYTPSSASGFMVGKFTLCIMIIVGLLLA